MYRYDRNSNIFENIETEEQAYWLGFLTADGYINEEHNFITLGLGIKDGEHIIKFQDFLQTNQPYTDRLNNGGHECRFFRLHDKKIVNDLSLLGLHQKKSFTVEPPKKISEELWRHWLRGVFDGDGSIYPHTSPKAHERYYIGLCGTEPILFKAQELLQISRKLDYNHSVPKFTVCKKEEVNKCLEFMYNDSKVFLNRKKELSKKAIEINLL